MFLIISKTVQQALRPSAEDIDYSNKAEERLTCSFQGDDMQIGFNARFLTEMLSNLSSDQIQFYKLKRGVFVSCVLCICLFRVYLCPSGITLNQESCTDKTQYNRMDN